MLGRQSAQTWVTIVLAVSFGIGSARAGDWPTCRHDIARTGWTSDHLGMPLQPRWTYSSPGQPRTAWAGQDELNREGIIMVERVKFDDALHVAVVNDRLYFGSSVDHKVHCLRVADGTELWSFCTGGPVRLAPTVYADRVLFGADDGYAYCLDAQAGRLIWKVHPSPNDEWLLSRGEMISRWPVRTGVLVDRDVAYFGAGIFPHENVYLYAVDFHTGKLLWKQDGISETDFDRNDLSPQGHMLLREDMLYVPSGGTLPGAGSWTHQYAEPGNSACSDDQRVHGDLGVLWYGEPGPAEMINRHNSAVTPLAMDGRLFVQGEHKILAYDAYNGLFLWDAPDPHARDQNAGRGSNPGNMAAGDGRIFVVAGNVCGELDAATGQSMATHRLPPGVDEASYEWQYVAYAKGLLVGTAVQSSKVVAQARRRGHTMAPPGRSVMFAIDTRTQRTLWTYSGHRIALATVAFNGDRVFFIDNSLTSEERNAFLRQDKRAFQGLTGDAAQKAEAQIKSIDVRQAIAIDARSGQTLWWHSVDVTDCSGVGSAGGALTLMHHDGALIVCGANGNGHYWAQFMAGEFRRRRLVALDADDGRVLWAKDANYRHRPIIVEQRVIAEPWAFDLRTGQQQMRAHPITGESVPWDIMRDGNHCGAIAGCPHLLVFRSWSTAFYDLDADVGTQHFSGQRPGCWINAIPANGLVMVPDASAGCVCLFSIESTIVMEPRAPRRPWTIASSTGSTTPVQHLALNFGGPGDRRDSRGTLWLAYPRPAAKKFTGLEILLDLKAKRLPRGGYRNVDSEATHVAGTDTPWLFTSWAHGVTSLAVPLLASSDPPARYHVKLYFADMSSVGPGVRVFDVKLQGNTVLSKFDPAAKQGVTVHEFRDVAATDQLRIELVPSEKEPSADQMPILSALEITRSDLR